MIIHVNGESRDVSLGLTLTDLVQELKLAAERVAIELNHRVIRRVEWQDTGLREGDRVEIVHFVGGGDSNGVQSPKLGAGYQVPGAGEQQSSFYCRSFEL